MQHINYRLKSNSSSPTSTSKIARTIPIKNWLALGVLPFVSLAAHAQVTEGSYSLSPYVGQNLIHNRQNLDDSLVYGARLGYAFTPHFSLEGALGFVDTNVEDTTITGAREGRYRSPVDDVEVNFYNLDALYHFHPDQRFNPYLVAGLGAARYSPEIADKDMATFNFGLGAKYWFNDNLGLRFDLRDYVVGEVFQESFNNIQATVGLAFAFGGHSKSTVQATAKPTPSAPASTRAAPAPQVRDEVVLEFEDVHFAFDKSQLSNEAKSILRDSVATLKANPKAKVRIAGYTSASGTTEYNQALSERRAQAIKTFLISEGIQTSRLTTIGYGDERPASHEKTPSDLTSKAAKANMRALFEIVVE